MGQTRRTRARTLNGTAFLRLVLQHILLKDYHRARHLDFLHPNSQFFGWRNSSSRWPCHPQALARRYVAHTAAGGVLKIIRTRIKPFIGRLRTSAAD
ncbi:MAG TPA: hypothetical protein PKG49_03185 [Nitrosomonas mobilis]|nr:hypothetical protein [Nitrosomonas mobilis]